ncbi:MAG TPA: response regulator [Candidatus Angelobacter sp.]|jgi:CheY-like chemotaxis protein|nr:response regulator [Candidatus Angelobacter sp.]
MSTTPTVYFIDDSATMREVIKIAFRRENINVVACHDAASALGEIEKSRPDIVITDVIMPGKDGYEVCQHIKSHAMLSKTPVILMSGVVNRAVAERAFLVKADELLRKPFQPQDLIARVKHLLKPNGTPAPTPASAANAAVALSSIFSSAAPPPQPRPTAVPGPRAVPAIAASVAAAPAPAPTPAPSVVATMPMPAPAPAPTPQISKLTASSDGAKLKIEIMRLEGLVKKLQSELTAEREYSHALEAHIKTLQEAE